MQAEPSGHADRCSDEQWEQGVASEIKDVAAKAHRVDRHISEVATEARETPAVRIAAAIGEVADQPPLIALTSVTIVAGAVLRQPVVVRTGVRMLASHLLATWVKTGIKRSIDRTRPRAALEGDAYKLEPGGDHGHDLASFPSGHTAGAVAVTRALARDVPQSMPYGLAASAAVAAIQLPNAKHYTSDVAAGAAIGLASEWLVSAALPHLERALTNGIRRASSSASRPGRHAPR